MTRRHFEMIARILKKQKEAEEQGQAYDIVEAFADFCECENSHFNREMFFNACGVKM